MKKLLLPAAFLAATLAAPALANPLLFALNEQPNCQKEVANSNVLHIAGMSRSGSNGVKLKIKQSKTVKASGGEFRKAKADFTACMQRRLEAHSIVIK